VKVSIPFHLKIWAVRVKYRKLTDPRFNGLLTTPDASQTPPNKTIHPLLVEVEGVSL